MTVLLFPAKIRRCGEVYIYPCADDDGCWAVDHWSESGDSGARLGAFMSIFDAHASARYWALKLNARYRDGGVSL